MHDASVRPAVRGLRTGWIALATLIALIALSAALVAAFTRSTRIADELARDDERVLVALTQGAKTVERLNQPGLLFALVIEIACGVPRPAKGSPVTQTAGKHPGVAQSKIQPLASDWMQILRRVADRDLQRVNPVRSVFAFEGRGKSRSIDADGAEHGAKGLQQLAIEFVGGEVASSERLCGRCTPNECPAIAACVR